MGLALFITILQDPHPVTELDVIWNRFVGIVLGVIAMRLAFAFPGLTPRLETDVDQLEADADHQKAAMRAMASSHPAKARQILSANKFRGGLRGCGEIHAIHSMPAKRRASQLVFRLSEESLKPGPLPARCLPCSGFARRIRIA